jgi:hypothetical protein
MSKFQALERLNCTRFIALGLNESESLSFTRYHRKLRSQRCSNTVRMPHAISFEPLRVQTQLSLVQTLKPQAMFLLNQLAH